MKLSSINNILNIKNGVYLKNAVKPSFRGLSNDVFEPSEKRAYGQCIEKPINAQEKVLLGILGSQEKLFQKSISSNSSSYEIKIPIDGYDDTYQSVKKVTCFNGKKPDDDMICVLDIKENTVHIYNNDGELKNKFSSEDMQALKYYKYHPDAIHYYLRHNRQKYGMDWHQEMIDVVDKLGKLYENPHTYMTIKEDMVLYRALQDILSPEDIQKLSTVGEIYTDKSFVSTSTSLDVAKRFVRTNPILEISIPKGSKYIDIEKLFNIDRRHWREDEYLLPKNSNFLVTGFDEEKNIIKVEYLPE